MAKIKGREMQTQGQHSIPKLELVYMKRKPKLSA